MTDRIQNTFEVKGIGDSDTTIISINDLIVFAFGLDGLKRFRARINERIEWLEFKARVAEKERTRRDSLPG